MIELNKFINIAKLDKYSAFLRYRNIELYLPTECYIEEPQICTPKIARVFSTEYYLLDNEIVNYAEARTKLGKNFHGTSSLTGIWLWEVWLDTGSDGHTEYTISGYIFSTMEPKTKKYPTSEINELMYNAPREEQLWHKPPEK